MRSFPRMGNSRLRVGTLAALLSASCLSASAQDEDQLVTRIQQATVLLVPPVCAGVLVGEGDWVLTAAHCVHSPGSPLPVTLHDGRSLDGTLVVVDRDNDMALVKLERRAPFEALEVAEVLPPEGESIFFVGRADRPIPAQLVSIERLAPCPSLPAVPKALHTGMRGEPGDSGAPVVDLDAKVVGLVHGGAACSIAAPTAPIAPVLHLLEG